ncbi:MAG: glycoside hydrolase family 99-like domain-containing protein [Phycisphaerales bacterium]|nr:glycoside hydrolase family 99-like domain-containing protein [Phycisphaerales bacterium]
MSQRLTSLLIVLVTAFMFAESGLDAEEGANSPAASKVYIRNLSMSRAIPRTGRREHVIAVIRSLNGGASALNLSVAASDGITVDAAVGQPVPRLGRGEVARFEWPVKAERPLTGKIKVTLHDSRSKVVDSKCLEIRFEPSPGLSGASYVPKPEPVKSDYLLLANHCPLWKYGAHVHGWDTIDPWPERKPAIGFYDEGDPIVTDWHIKHALEHGISGFIYVWDKTLMNPNDKNSLGAAIHDGFLRARYRDLFKFCLNWETSYASHNGVRDDDEVLTEILPYWIEKYFQQPTYLKIDNKPILFVTKPGSLEEQLGGPKAIRQVLDAMREKCRKSGFAGLTVIGCVPAAKPRLQERLEQAGYDATSAYDVWTDGWANSTKDREGIPVFSHREMMIAQKDVLLAKKRSGSLPDIVTVHMGWDSRPWHGKETVYYMGAPSAANFEIACRNAKKIVDSTPGKGLDTRIVVLNNWNEFGEGHYIAPTAGFGFSFLDAVRKVFCRNSKPCVHLTPEDVGLEPPEKVYAASRGTMRYPYAKKPTVGDNLVAWWRFDKANPHVAFDSSACGFDGFKDRCTSVEGASGRAVDCRDRGTVSLGVHDLFYPQRGVTIEFWCRREGNQDRVYLLNTASEEYTGYGISLEKGKPTFYINWTQMIQCPDPIAMSDWTHVAATSDNREMALYVNGVEKVRLPRGNRIRPAKSGSICIGAYGASGSETFDGALDELRIHDRPLSAKEVKQSHARTVY